MNDDKKKGYPAHSTEDNRFKSQDEFDNTPKEDRKAEQDEGEAPATSTAQPDPMYKDISKEGKDD